MKPLRPSVAKQLPQENSTRGEESTINAKKLQKDKPRFTQPFGSAYCNIIPPTHKMNIFLVQQKDISSFFHVEPVPPKIVERAHKYLMQKDGDICLTIHRQIEHDTSYYKERISLRKNISFTNILCWHRDSFDCVLINHLIFITSAWLLSCLRLLYTTESTHSQLQNTTQKNLVFNISLKRRILQLSQYIKASYDTSRVTISGEQKA